MSKSWVKVQRPSKAPGPGSWTELSTGLSGDPNTNKLSAPDPPSKKMGGGPLSIKSKPMLTRNTSFPPRPLMMTPPVTGLKSFPFTARQPGWVMEHPVISIGSPALVPSQVKIPELTAQVCACDSARFKKKLAVARIKKPKTRDEVFGMDDSLRKVFRTILK